MNKRILIIEDEEKIARVLQLELNHEGYQTESAFTGKAGLERAEAEEWDLILLDVMLPELNGIEVLRRYRKKNGSTPVILLTARDAVPDKVNGLDHGANDYVTKPFEIEELLARIRACFRTHVRESQSEGEADELKIHDLKLNLGTRELHVNSICWFIFCKIKIKYFQGSKSSHMYGDMTLQGIRMWLMCISVICAKR